MGTISWEDFEKVDIRVGKVVEVLDFPEARKPAYKIKIDFGSENRHQAIERAGRGRTFERGTDKFSRLLCSQFPAEKHRLFHVRGAHARLQEQCGRGLGPY